MPTKNAGIITGGSDLFITIRIPLIAEKMQVE